MGGGERVGTILHAVIFPGTMCPEGGAFITFVMVEIFTILVFLKGHKTRKGSQG